MKFIVKGRVSILKTSMVSRGSEVNYQTLKSVSFIASSAIFQLKLASIYLVFTTQYFLASDYVPVPSSLSKKM